MHYLNVNKDWPSNKHYPIVNIYIKNYLYLALKLHKLVIILPGYEIERFHRYRWKFYTVVSTIVIH